MPVNPTNASSPFAQPPLNTAQARLESSPAERSHQFALSLPVIPLFAKP